MPPLLSVSRCESHVYATLTTAHAELRLDPVDEVLNSIATCDPAVFDIGPEPNQNCVELSSILNSASIFFYVTVLSI